MDTTASSFTLRKNAKRAAEAMIRNGTAPAVDYDINPSGRKRADPDTLSFPRERVRCVPGMLNSSEVKVLYPT